MRKDMLTVLISLILGLTLLGMAYEVYLLFTSSSAALKDSYLGLYFAVMAITFGIIFGKNRERKKINKLNQTQQQTVVALQEEKNRFDTIFEQANTGIALLSLDGKICKANKALCELLGYSEADMLAMNFHYLIPQSELNALQVNIQNLLNKQIHLYKTAHECFRKNGESIWVLSMLSLIRDHNNVPIYFILQVQNITLQKQAEERLSHMAYHDPLTGLANRNKLEQFISHMLASARRHQQSFALLFLDLDRFKNINDTIGHEAGDMLLQIVAERLRIAVRNTDMVARLGGDEFVLVITDVTKSESVALIAQKILENILHVIVIKGQELYITTSIGISLYPYDGQSMQSLMKNADLALYRAKEQGRNNYQFYTLEMTSKAKEKLSLQNALGHALVKNEFYLNYQPKMALKNRCITGIEALLRWNNQEYGLITPDEIVVLAEETGLIIPVSDWILKTACQELKRWHDMGMTTLTMAVNCSGRQFKQAHFVEDIAEIITELGLSPKYIEIEVTEATIMQDPDNTLRVLDALKAVGVQIAIDDFGTGYWSLSNLRRLSVDKIKIDRTFIKQVTVDETSATIVSAIIAMANKLGILAIAEGVETREQYEFLLKEGCGEIQGYYLTQPLSGEEMTAFLKHPIPDAESITKKETFT